MLTRENFLGSFTRRYLDVDTVVGPVRIQNLNEKELCEFQSGQLTRDGKLSEPYQKMRRRRLVAACMVDHNGERILSYSDCAAMANVDGAVISAIFAAAIKHCGMAADEEDREKNSDEATDADFPTGSRCAGESPT